ncbi:MAG: sigma-70 family RNA polymerase sigma factor [Gemmatimonadetes bacterium]|uniref:Sigma-70 family RNA polymerase sigma factor n=1 Tax=Candidatus Kutchimonas denitrificans TaxID=3056748 RepID=A0AAE4ZBE6_9BACT|nr:sigma-70 family RNA polymerase sigma factor [Gemmatimonadota bacterium]NIR74380.1 sigma-70 family RNA polymerase sigma factor [Candidatus Kutchimonas denitrificans]NIS02631.1 sigma-70 family RNA polymerase sigma factor [Gemmatimonadota bacterium]NIT68506.1 sigma-70 family RNA polymerase sigma factor [Gemmatimonadota bacterium]NIU51983.1 sigma-70 family RNA polymerase sigma factor [Gemmatimonadota bacterium]
MSRQPASKREHFEREALVHLDTLYNVALRLTGNASDAEDLVQDTVTKAYRSWDKYEPGTNCRAWLVTILRNTFINQFRRESRRPSKVEFEAVQEINVFEAIKDRDPEGTFFRFIVDEEVKRAIQDLPEEFRLPVVLSDVEGLSYAEIAEILDLPVGTVKSRLFRGRRRLQQRLYDYALEMGYIRS